MAPDLCQPSVFCKYPLTSKGRVLANTISWDRHEGTFIVSWPTIVKFFKCLIYTFPTLFQTFQDGMGKRHSQDGQEVASKAWNNQDLKEYSEYLRDIVEKERMTNDSLRWSSMMYYSLGHRGIWKWVLILHLPFNSFMASDKIAKHMKKTANILILHPSLYTCCLHNFRVGYSCNWLFVFFANLGVL